MAFARTEQEKAGEDPDVERALTSTRVRAHAHASPHCFASLTKWFAAKGCSFSLWHLLEGTCLLGGLPQWPQIDPCQLPEAARPSLLRHAPHE